MRVLVAGATGVIGRQLVPMLLARDHEVVAVSRSGAVPRGVGARVRAEAVDALDAHAVRAVVMRHAPEAVVHLLTRVPHDIDPRHMTRDFDLTNRLRTAGMQHLLDAWSAPGTGTLIAQGLAWAYDPEAVPVGTLATEQSPLWRHPPREWVTSRDAIGRLEDLTASRGGLVLRLGHLYGPGTAFAADGSLVRQVRTRRLPVVGGGTAVFSFTHTADAAAAVVAALESRTQVTGSLNIVDDDPAPVSEWLPELARLVGAPPPRRVPALLARPVAGSWGVAFQTRLRGAANARARAELGWSPTHPSWRAALAKELAGAR